MKKLIIVNTYYQLIISIQMKHTLFKNDEVAIIITDHSVNAEKISHNVKELNIFEHVYYVETSGAKDSRTIPQKLTDIFALSLCRHNRFYYYIDYIEDKYFDELITFNFDMRIYGVFILLAEVNKNIKFSRYEEGILSYSTEVIYTKAREIVEKVRNKIGKPIIKSAILNYYCFYPDLYKGMFNVCKIPLIDNNYRITKLIREVFDIDTNNLNHDHKYIFFTSVYDFEGGESIGEYELVCKVANLVGKNNLLVKTHPRDSRKIYQKNGFNVDVNSSVPWEAIQLSFDFSNKIFLTVNSGSVLSGSTMSEKPVKTFYMYKLCDINGNKSCQKNAQDIEALLCNSTMKDIFYNVRIAEKIEDIL